ncbi:hypothetical protein BTVI_56398 [Pitangus sulphuratus]|nr:hypothetical protein BTVI_56398 [Pitangus sulphuratus]
MEGSSPAEAWHVPQPPKQHSQSGSRTPVPLERPEATHGPHAVLESKVKALKEKRGGGRLGTPAATPERPSPKKPRPQRGKPGVDVAAVEPQAQLQTYLTDGLLDGGEPVDGSPPAPCPGTPGLWRVPAHRRDVLGGTELPQDKDSRSRCSASLHERHSLDEEARTLPWDQGGPSVCPPVAEGWERLSLSERVERNRRLLQEVLGLAAPEMPASDGDWDSGVSLQDTEGCRAFVPGQELELSPRHEQAKQLLQRARMKARTNPLRASHDIFLLPTALPHPREPSGRPSVAPRDGGSLSDSSSGESSCGRPRRPRGPSPSRVRFEDESARDAEVRYLERLQLRHRRALGSALSSPEPAGSRQPGDGAGQPRARRGDLVAEGKCSACGSLLGAAAGRGTDAQAATDAAKSSPAAQRSIPRDSKGPSSAQTEPKIRPLGPGGSPLWILPSRQRIHTEKIKETYIGDVTYIDEVDSALESTDTSDGCRTDSEEPRRPASRKGSSASASGLKKLLCSLSQSTKERLGRFRCYSMEQLPAPSGSPPGGPGMKKSPSLQSLQLVSPFCQPQKASSIQSLHPLLGKAPRASAYLRPQTTADRKGGSEPWRSLSVEDIGAPGRLRAVGRVVEVFPDGTSQLELQRPPNSAFGFSVTSGHGRPDKGVYVQEMADAGTAKLYAGLLGVGDEILQVNGAAVSGLGLPRIREMLLQVDTLSLRVLRHRPLPR